MRCSRWPSVDAFAGQVLMRAVAKWSASLHDASVVKQREWLEKHFRANGMAFSKLRDEK